MVSLYLGRLSGSERDELLNKLAESQEYKCFICHDEIDLKLHKDDLDIDHIIPSKNGGKDDPSNFALTHSSCNRSKQASDLRVARILAHFQKIQQKTLDETHTQANLSHILECYGGSKFPLNYSIEKDSIKYSFSGIGDNQILKSPIYTDPVSNFRYFFAFVPLEYIFHDDRINPRSIGKNVSKLVQEFFVGRPQLHISLGYILTTGDSSQINVFDGQHKAVAQILLNTRQLPVRIFIDPDLDVLLTANTNAGTSLRQVAFDKSVQRHLGNALYYDRIQRYKKERGLAAEDFSFSEEDLVKYFKGESREMKRYIIDAVRDSITHHPENKLRDYIDFGGRGKEKPISYSTLEKTVYSFFILQDVLHTPLDFRFEQDDNPRENEKEQLLRLMNIIADEIYIGKFDPDIGTSMLESNLRKGENIPEDHMTAFRMSKEEIMYNWLKFLDQIIKNYFIMQGTPINEDKLFQEKFPEPLWANLRLFIKNFRGLPIWVNKELSLTVFGGKQNNAYWETIFTTGKTPQGLQVLSEPINLMNLIKNK